MARSVRHWSSRWLASLVVGVVGLLCFAAPAGAIDTDYDFKGPVFGLQARGGALYAADSGAGIVRLGAKAKLVIELRNAIDVAPLGHKRFWVLTSAKGDKSLYFVHRGRARLVADIGRFEKRKNPDGGVVDSNPFDLEAIGGGEVLIADAGGNDLLVADRKGHLNWVVTLPTQDVSTQDIKDLVGCPTPSDPSFQDICDLPASMPAQPVPTSVAVGPDGAYYVTELKGFPAPRIRSRVWRIDPDIRHVNCRGSITTNGCTVAARNLTSIVDLNFDSAGNAYVDELDEATWFAVEAYPAGVEDGTIDQCDTAVTPWDCTIFAPHLVQPMAVALTASDTAYAVVKALKRHPAVVQLP